MRVTNDFLVNANTIFGASQPEILWGYVSGPYTAPSTDSFFTSRPLNTKYFYTRLVGTVAASGAAYGIVEEWVKGANNGLASDWSCVSGLLTYRLNVNDMTDGGAAAGTLDIVPTLPAGAFVNGSAVSDVVGFAADTSAVLIIGTSGDTDQFNTGTFNVFATAAIPAAVTTQNAPSGNRGMTAASTVRLTVTSATDFTLVKSNGLGRATIRIWYTI